MKKKIAFLSAYDAENTSSWSGTPYFMLHALKREDIEVITIGPVNSVIEPMLKLIKFTLGKIFNIKYNYTHSKILAYEYSVRFKLILKSHPDIEYIIAPASSTQIALLKTEIPILYISDTTFGQINDYYPYFEKIAYFSKKESDKIEMLALNNATLISFPSLWASQYTEINYKIDKNKIKTIPWGPNLKTIPSLKKRILPSKKNELYCLFLGVDWFRKGGDVAVKAVQYARSKGNNINLIICGCVPIGIEPADWMTIIPSLNKNNTLEYDKFCDLLTNTDVLLLPTKAECYGMVFCEASAYGIPSIATNTGGIPSIIEHNKSGLLIEDPNDYTSFGEALHEILSNDNKYYEMSTFARARYERELNWGVWAKETLRFINDKK